MWKDDQEVLHRKGGRGAKADQAPGACLGAGAANGAPELGYAGWDGKGAGKELEMAAIRRDVTTCNGDVER